MVAGDSLRAPQLSGGRRGRSSASVFAGESSFSAGQSSTCCVPSWIMEADAGPREERKKIWILFPEESSKKPLYYSSELLPKIILCSAPSERARETYTLRTWNDDFSGSRIQNESFFRAREKQNCLCLLLPLPGKPIFRGMRRENGVPFFCVPICLRSPSPVFFFKCFRRDRKMQNQFTFFFLRRNIQVLRHLSQK